MKNGSTQSNYSPDHYNQAFADFNQAYPSFDADAIQALRTKEYGRLDDLNQVYLDYTGGGL